MFGLSFHCSYILKHMQCFKRFKQWIILWRNWFSWFRVLKSTVLPLLLVYINSHYCWCLFTENHTDGTKCELSVSPDELHDGQGKSGYSYRKEPSYFEIPTKEIHSKPKTASQEVQEIPTKDTDHKPPATPPVVQGHASFTIEFDDQTPGKMKIKDHFTKLSIRQRNPRNPSKESIARLTEVMSVENKVADWLVQSDATMMKRLEEQSETDKLLNKTFKGKRQQRTVLYSWKGFLKK